MAASGADIAIEVSSYGIANIKDTNEELYEIFSHLF